MLVDDKINDDDGYHLSWLGHDQPAAMGFAGPWLMVWWDHATGDDEVMVNKW